MCKSNIELTGLEVKYTGSWLLSYLICFSQFVDTLLFMVETVLSVFYNAWHRSYVQ